MMTRRDHQKNITRATKRSGRPDKVLWVIVRATYVSSCPHKMWQSRQQKIKFKMKNFFLYWNILLCFPSRAANIVTFLWGGQTHLDSQQEYGNISSASQCRLNMVHTQSHNQYQGPIPRGQLGEVWNWPLLLHLIKVKAVPLEARIGPESSMKLRFPDFMTTAQDDGKVVSLTHRPFLPLGNTPDTHFY